ncbi:hypothetical protein D3C80_1523170 [compost metagenome]
MVDRDIKLANQRQTGVLEQVVDIVNRAGTGVFNRDDGVISLPGFDLIKDIGEFCAATFNEFFEMTCRILARC